MPHPIYIVDVFAERAYAGNPLAVVGAAADLSDQTMQQVAAQLNYSETTFIRSGPDTSGAYQVRIFTPAREIAFAGHPILGTAWVIRNDLAPRSDQPVRLNIGVGQIAVTFEASNSGELAWFRAPDVALGATCAPTLMAAALGISPEDIEVRTPVQQCSAGMSALLVPVRNLDALARSRLDLTAFAPLAEQGFPPLVYVFCTETHHSENDLCARFFFEAHGVREDPASGNAAAFLGAYLLEHQAPAGAELSLRIEQGYEIRRPSLVLLRARMNRGSPVVNVGGNVIPILRGELS